MSLTVRNPWPWCAVALLLGGIPSTAFAYCVGWDKTRSNFDSHYYSIAQEFRRSLYVVKAKVLREVWIGEGGKEELLRPPFQNGQRRPWGFDPYLGAFYDLEVETSFKGSTPKSIRVFSENSTARFWLREGQEILAFVSPEEFETPIGRQLTLDTCGNFGLFPEANTKLPAVRIAEKQRR